MDIVCDGVVCEPGDMLDQSKFMGGVDGEMLIWVLRQTRH
jgi:hypothetical protein